MNSDRLDVILVVSFSDERDILKEFYQIVIRKKQIKHDHANQLDINVLLE